MQSLLPPPCWDIENERKQAEGFAIRAAILEDVDMPGTNLFRELADLCDRKIELFKKLEHNHAKFKSPEWRRKAVEGDHMPWEDLEL